MARLALFFAAISRVTWALDEGRDDVDYDDFDIEESLSSDQLRLMHSKFDLNGDDKVNLNEIMSYARQAGKAIATNDIASILEEIDVNRDGALSLDEHMIDIANQADGGDEEEKREMLVRQEVERTKFEIADENKDGLLHLNELAALFYPETHDGVLDITVRVAMKAKDWDGDGKLTPREFWEAIDESEDELDLSEEEHQDFAKLDTDKDGMLSLEELRPWESGRFHTEDAMRKLFDIADKDRDMHITANELASSRELIAATDAQYHLLEWAEHHEL